MSKIILMDYNWEKCNQMLSNVREIKCKNSKKSSS